MSGSLAGRLAWSPAGGVPRLGHRPGLGGARAAVLVERPGRPEAAARRRVAEGRGLGRGAGRLRHHRISPEPRSSCEQTHPIRHSKVNNVGQRDRRGTLDLPPSDFERLVNADLVAAYGLSRLVATPPGLRASPGGDREHLVRGRGLLANRGDVAYATAKGIGRTDPALAADLRPYGIPGQRSPRATSPPRRMPIRLRTPDRLAWVEARTMLRRWGQPQEIAGLGGLA